MSGCFNFSLKSGEKKKVSVPASKQSGSFVVVVLCSPLTD